MATATASILVQHAALGSSSDAECDVTALVEGALSRANSNASRNTYLWQDRDWTLSEARQAAAKPAGGAPLRGIPVSVKDCFDLAGSPTSCGTLFYRGLHGRAERDSWLVERLRAAGAVITGKTHLHPIAYGLTGENRDFGDCLQPGADRGALTGGSSSGAAASVLEGSAMAAIGTDTGGSVRVPAALCGLAGYRASHGRGDWRGAAHLAPSFDTFGWLFRDLEDGPLLASIFGAAEAASGSAPLSTFAIVHEEFLSDCEPAVRSSLERCIEELSMLGLPAERVEVDWWREAPDIFAPIQAAEAAQVHAGHFAEFEPAIQQRLNWGASLSEEELVQWRDRHARFRGRMDELLARHQLLLWPAAPVSRLAAGVDHSGTRARLLRYTTPASLAGIPAVTIPFLHNGRPAGGMQLVAAREDDARLLAVAAELGRNRRRETRTEL